MHKEFMKAKCINTDPLGWLQVGAIYDCVDVGVNVIVRGTGVVLSKGNFEEVFEIVEE